MARLDMPAVSRLMNAVPPKTVDECAAALGISQSSFRVARDVSYLLEEDGLTEKELGLVLEAYRTVAAGDFTAARKMVEPLMKVRFGDPKVSGAKVMGGPISYREHHRERFKTALVSLVDHMLMSSRMHVPFMGRQDRKSLCDELDRGMREVQALKNTIMIGGSNVPEAPEV